MGMASQSGDIIVEKELVPDHSKVSGWAGEESEGVRV